ncbi:kinase-like domain-containing protein [Gorgonomyces haynaldii]|nr:kinase-like domain-containing protein [Gorgonomyces haynaldii]
MQFHTLQDPSKTSTVKPTLGHCKHIDEFQKVRRIGEGTYGIVYKAQHKETKQIVALKRLRTDLDSEGFSLSSLREISLLKRLDHESIVKCYDIIVGDNIDDVFLLMEYCSIDLATLMDTATENHGLGFRIFEIDHVKTLLQQLLRGVRYLHEHFVIHRDLKLSNLLVSQDGYLKIADFGLARPFGDPLEQLTPRVVTVWYRSPELLLGTKSYNTSIDMWAVGCIFGELLRAKPLLPGKDEINQIERICDLLGSPTTDIWPDLISMPLYGKIKLPEYEYDNVSVVFSEFSKATRNLIKDLLIYDPDQRISARKALKHPYFLELPVPCPPSSVARLLNL